MAAIAEQLKLLRQPFPAHQISVLPKPLNKDSPKGKCGECGGYHRLPAVHLSYVGHAALTDRLLDVDPFWTWEPLALDECGLPKLDANGGLWIKLTICGVTRFGYGDAQGKTGPDAMKERIGDALRNAAMRFGAALELWHKGDLHGNDDEDDDKKPREQAKTSLESDLELSIAATELRKCGSIAALQKAWLKLPNEHRRALADVKEECKQEILKADAIAENERVA